MAIPGGWTDNGSELHAPNGHFLVLGNRQYVLNHPNWNPQNVPLEQEHGVDNVQLHNLDLGKGTRVCLRDGVLWWTEKAGVIYEQQLGYELFTCYQIIDALKKEISGDGLSIVGSVKDYMEKVASSLQSFANNINLASGQSSDGSKVVSPLLIDLISSISQATQDFQTETSAIDNKTEPLPNPD